MIKGARDKVVQAIDGLDPNNASFSETFNALRIIHNELRIEYDDQPTQRHQFTETEVDAEINRMLGMLLQQRHALAPEAGNQFEDSEFN